MTVTKGKRAEVRDIDAAALTAIDHDRLDQRRSRVTRRIRLARHQLSKASSELVIRFPKKARWYCLQIAGGFEFTVEKFLTDVGVEVLVPREKWISVRKGKKFEGERAVIPGYLLTRIVPSAEAFAGFIMQKQIGVVNIVGGSGGYHAIRDNDVAIFKRLSTSDVERMEADKTIADGCAAMITHGPFAGFRCTVLAVKWARIARGRVRIDVDGKDFDVDNVPIAFLEKL
ncbi:MAG TPA: transcription termination/antitermination NusG family protein [Shinella sp.]|jgi:transcriptional antiterminator NusG|uniref:transcription termination/antitermination protein NusG n=1 Tax=Shinella sp. TaxID=1870904 RepID=UPI002E13F17E|nr:transcription termination/antitermination NusG family protein [Shinella sp.]